MYNRVLVGTDGSTTATRAVEAAAVIASAHEAELVVAYAFPPRPTVEQVRAWRDAPEELRWRLTLGTMAEGVVDDAITRARASAAHTISIRGRCEPGRPVPVLLQLVDELDPDVLVVGNRDMHGWRLGRSIARVLSRRAACDVVIVDTVGRRRHRQAAIGRPATSWA